MTAPSEKSSPLPSFRPELRLFKGPDEPDGSPTYNLYDPVRSQYFRLGWIEATVLQVLKPGMSISDLKSALEKDSLVRISEQEILAFFQEAGQRGLLHLRPEGAFTEQKAQRQRRSMVMWVLMNYLFFRIPIFNPDGFLTRTLPYARPFLTRTALYCYFLIILIGVLFIFTRWEDFVHTFVYFFTWTGIVAWGIALALTKVIHEMAHAYTAKKYGVRIPTMGVAFIVLYPVLYTDATDAWKLPDRRKRLAIVAAGVLTELVIAALCTIAWAYSNPGIMQSVFFFLASANWINTLVINVNPALRFDGYYLLSDILKVDNLQLRSFRVARTRIYNFLFGLNLPDPEPDMEKGRQYILTIYAVYASIYRIILYTAIAIFVYVAFTKILGIFLFILEISVFLVWPAYGEAKYLYSVRNLFQRNPRLLTSAAVGLGLLAWVLIPWPHSYQFPAITVPVANQVIYAPASGYISHLTTKRDQSVEAGAVLLVIRSPEVENRLATEMKEQEILQKKAQLVSESEELRPLYLEKRAELSRVGSEVQKLQDQIAKHSVRAPYPGVIYLWDDLLRDDQFVKRNQVLGKLAKKGEMELVCFVPEKELKMIYVGKPVVFHMTGTRDAFKGTVQRIEPVRADHLQYPELASIYAGPLPTIQQPNSENLTLLESYYPVLISLSAPGDLRIGQVGDVRIKGTPRSHLMNWIRSAIALFQSESGL